VIQLDIMPTAVAVAGGSMPTDRPIDGVNLMPYLTGKQTAPPHEVLFWRMGPQAAVRKGDWKLIRHEGAATASQPAARAARKSRPGAKRQPATDEEAASRGPAGIGPAGSVHLYNLAKDIHEDNDLAAQNPEKVKELSAALDAWESQLAKPLWSGKARFQGSASQPAGREPAEGRGRRARRNR